MAGDKDNGGLRHFILRVTAMLVYFVFTRTFFALWKMARPFLTYFTNIYGTIDLDALDPLYVLQTFLKWALMVMAYIWQLLKWLANKILDIVPGARRLLAEINKIIDQVDHEYRFLLRPLNLGLFSRRGAING